MSGLRTPEEHTVSGDYPDGIIADRERIESIRRRAVAVDEIIVVDSAPEDDTQEVLARLSQGDPRIRLLQAPPEGPAKARNKGLAAAGGDLIAFLDADCLWTRDKLALQLAHRP